MKILYLELKLSCLSLDVPISSERDLSEPKLNKIRSLLIFLCLGDPCEYIHIPLNVASHGSGDSPGC